MKQRAPGRSRMAYIGSLSCAAPMPVMWSHPYPPQPVHLRMLASLCNPVPVHFQDLYRISRQLAAVVVPHEYGLDEQGKLLIGSKICSELLGKLLIDLESMKVGGAVA